MAGIELEFLKILITVTASIGTLAAFIYTWVLSRTHPKTWTLTGMTVLLWTLALQLWSQQFVLFYVGTATSSYIANTRSVFLATLLAGYLFFLYGTYNASPVRRQRKRDGGRAPEKSLEV